VNITDVDGDGRLHLVDRIDGSVNGKSFDYDPSLDPSTRNKPLGDLYDETLAGVNAELAKKYSGLKLDDLGALVPLVFKTKIIDAEDCSAPQDDPQRLITRISDARVFAFSNGIPFDEQWAVDTWEAGLQKFFEYELPLVGGGSQILQKSYDRIQDIKSFGGPSLSPEGERRLAKDLVGKRLHDLERAFPPVPPSIVNADLKELKDLSEKHGLPWDVGRAYEIRKSKQGHYFDDQVRLLNGVLAGHSTGVYYYGDRWIFSRSFPHQPLQPWENGRTWLELQSLAEIRGNLQSLQAEGGPALAPEMEAALLQGILERKLEVAKEHPRAVSPEGLREARIAVEAFADKHRIESNVQEAVEIERQLSDYWDQQGLRNPNVFAMPGRP